MLVDPGAGCEITAHLIAEGGGIASHYYIIPFFFDEGQLQGLVLPWVIISIVIKRVSNANLGTVDPVIIS